MSAVLAQSVDAAARPAAPEPDAGPAVPLGIVIDTDATTRQFLSLILHGNGVDAETYADSRALTEDIARRNPDLIFLDVPIDSSEAMASLRLFGQIGYRGKVQLMSARGAAVLAQARSIGEQQGLEMLPTLRKPFETGTILKLLHEHKLGHPPTIAGRVDLEEALAKNWIEFWFQPKIDLRRKQLIGAEAVPRARHPAHGVLLPGAFLPGAKEGALATLFERAASGAVAAAARFAELGVTLQMSLDIPLSVIEKLPLAEIAHGARDKIVKWPGLVVEIAEDQAMTELGLLSALEEKLRPAGVRLALDEFGRAFSVLARLDKMPFVEIKIASNFIADCSADRVNAPLCKNVIDLAHNFGALTVACGIAKASDAVALVSMGCDLGQGFLLGQPMPEERFGALLRQRTRPKPRAETQLTEI
jgi:EAL domain-containing protein (putative c-di-GMP-specific phosphodiesterase class I)/CheY-like chemotaxis protein